MHLETRLTLNGTRHVTGEDGGGETVNRIVGLLDEVGLVSEFGDDDDRAEDLLLDDLGVGLGISEDWR